MNFQGPKSGLNKKKSLAKIALTRISSATSTTSEISSVADLATLCIQGAPSTSPSISESLPQSFIIKNDENRSSASGTIQVKPADAMDVGKCNNFQFESSTQPTAICIEEASPKILKNSINNSKSSLKSFHDSSSGDTDDQSESRVCGAIQNNTLSEACVSNTSDKICNNSLYSATSTVFLNDDQSETASSTLSNASFLPSITTFDARKRSYLAGCVSGHKSLLGVDELSRYFPERKIRVFVGTWNMNGKVPENLDDFLLPKDILYLPDIYVIGTQESMVVKKEWEIKLQATIGPSHVLFHSTVIGVLYLTIFMRRDLVWFCSIPEHSFVTTRPVTSIKTKGAIGIGFLFFGTSILFITSHLAAHDYNLKEREQEYYKIRKNLDLPKVVTVRTHVSKNDVTAKYDCVFWCGDLNYRIITDRSVVMNILGNKSPNTVKKLLHGDQLHNEMKMGHLFRSFHEGDIQFLPTYKYRVSTDDFDMSQKLRTPSYTDRILYRSRRRETIKCILYNSAPSLRTSDHKPVYGLFDVQIRPGTDNIPLAAGLFDREVYLEAIKLRSLHLVPDNPSASNVCSVM